MQVQITINVVGRKLDVEEVIYQLSELVVEKRADIGMFDSKLEFIDIGVLRVKPFNIAI